jgi:hypothetical protein
MKKKYFKSISETGEIFYDDHLQFSFVFLHWHVADTVRLLLDKCSNVLLHGVEKVFILDGGKTPTWHVYSKGKE